MKHKIKLIGFV